MVTVLRRVREARGITARSVASAINIDQSYYSKLETAKASASPGVAERLALFFAPDLTEIHILYPGRFAVPEAEEATA